jgi:hypothetical protein
MVDLGRVTDIAGVMLRTWHGNNKGIIKLTKFKNKKRSFLKLF